MTISKEQIEAALKDFKGSVTPISASFDEQYWECEIDVLTMQTIIKVLQERLEQLSQHFLEELCDQITEDNVNYAPVTDIDATKPVDVMYDAIVEFLDCLIDVPFDFDEVYPREMSMLNTALKGYAEYRALSDRKETENV